MPVANIPATPVPVIDEYGLTLPIFGDVHTWLQTVFREIFGYDIYIENDSQDGELIGVKSKAMHDAYSSVGAAYNAFSPATAQGAGLTRVCKINGIRRKAPSKSMVDVRIIGWVGTEILNGRVADTIDHIWELPPQVIIPDAAEIIVTATAQEAGAVFAPAHSVTRIMTTTRGWQSVDNPEASSTGAPIETDAMLRVRQSISTSIPAKSTYESLVGAVAGLPGTNRYRGYENETPGLDAYGLPGNSVSIVVEGGDDLAIATVIYKKKAPGTITAGTTSATVIDVYGIPHRVYFSRPVQVPVQVLAPVKPLGRFTSSKDLAIRSAVSDWINSHPIGELISIEELGAPAMLASPQFPLGDPTFRILPGIQAARIPNALTAADVPIAFNERATCTAADVILAFGGVAL